MQTDRIEAYFQLMRDPDEGVDTFVQTAILDTMVGRSLEAAIPVLEAVHDRLAKSDPRQGPLVLPGGATVEVVACPEGPHGGIWRKAILFGGGEGMHLAVLEVGGGPNPVVDAIVEKRLGRHRSAEERQALPCKAVRVYAARTSQEIAEALAADVNDSWSSSKALECRATIPPYEAGEPWNEYRRGTVTGKGLDVWPTFFERVSELFAATYTYVEMRQSATEVAVRQWRSVSSSDAMLAAERFGAELALRDGYLPGKFCVDALDTLDSLGAEAAMEHIARRLQAVADGMSGHPEILERGRFDANDGRNVARLRRTDADSFELELEDQNNRHLIRRAGDRIEIIGKRHGSGVEDRECLKLAFERAGDGRFRMEGRIGQAADPIRCWNSFKLAAATLDACVAEEIAERASVPRR